MYAKYVKRPIDFCLSLTALIFLSPLLLILIITGMFLMKGNPFFVQARPGKNEKIFNLIKFRTMSYAIDKNGILLSDENRLVPYGKMLRSTSLDELPSLINIIKGDLSIVGPRPLLIKYLSLYNEQQKRRHEVRPGLTGYAQVNGRNSVSWEDKFNMDVSYVDDITFLGDIKIILKTFLVVFKRNDINNKTCATMDEFTGTKNESEQIIKTEIFK